MSFKTALMSLTLMLFTSIAGAHPTDTTLIANIGVGTKFVFLKDVNIPAERTAIAFYQGITQNPSWSELFAGVRSDFGCIFTFTSSDHDRVINAGDSFTVGEVDGKHFPYGILTTIVVKLRDKTDLKLGCAEHKTPTIGDMKRHFGKWIQIVYPEPKKF